MKTPLWQKHPRHAQKTPSRDVQIAAAALLFEGNQAKQRPRARLRAAIDTLRLKTNASGDTSGAIARAKCIMPQTTLAAVKVQLKALIKSRGNGETHAPTRDALNNYEEWLELAIAQGYDMEDGAVREKFTYFMLALCSSSFEEDQASTSGTDGTLRDMSRLNF